MHFIFFDEAKIVYDAQRDRIQGLGIGEISKLTGQIREFLEGIIAADQMPTWISEALKSNVYTTICLSQSGGTNIHEMGKNLNLNKDQLNHLTQLVSDRNQGLFEGIVKMNGRWPTPFVIEIIQIKIEKSVTNYELNCYMQPILEDLNKRVTPRTPYKKILEEKLEKKRQEEQKRREAKTERSESGQNTENHSKPTETVEGNLLIKLLTQIRDFPFTDQKERIQMLGLSSSSSTNAKYFNELVVKGFVHVHKIGFGKGQSTKVFYEITEEGREYAKMKKFVIPGKSSDFKHKFWQHTIKNFYESAGYKPEIEKLFGNKNVDVGLEDKGRKIAIEVELSPDHLIENIQRDLDGGCDKIIIAVPSRRSENTYKKKISYYNEELLNKIEFRILTDFLP